MAVVILIGNTHYLNYIVVHNFIKIVFEDYFANLILRIIKWKFMEFSHIEFEQNTTKLDGVFEIVH
jgi:hypothetical protein